VAGNNKNQQKQKTAKKGKLSSPIFPSHVEKNQPFFPDIDRKILIEPFAAVWTWNSIHLQ
jgi:hypothetical protein